jgi:hypothetical protein
VPGAYLYPWDVDGDPAAADRVAGLGLTGVSLAAAYHAVRAVTPFHPGHRIVTRDASVYYRADPARWSGAALRPAVAEPAGSFERAAGQVRAAGLSVTAWVVLTHNSRLAAAAAAGAECAVRNVFGDRYPWALCAGSAAVREYAARLAAEAAALPEVDAIELEACGWYGFGHGSAHDKTGDVTGRAGPAGEWLFSLCFCAGCRDGYAAAGADPGNLASVVRAAADGSAALPGDAADVLDSTPGRGRPAAARRGDQRGPRRRPGQGSTAAHRSRSPRHRLESRLRSGLAVRPGRRRRTRAVLHRPGGRTGSGRADRGGGTARHPDRGHPARRGRAGR